MILIKPKFVALDSAHYIDLVKDLNAADSSHIRQSKQFQSAMIEHGYVPFLTFHHFSELLKYEDVSVVRDTVAYIRGLPAVAWVSSFGDKSTVGSILDVFIAEVVIANKNPKLTDIGVRDKARINLVQSGTGEQAVRPFLNEWQKLQPHLLESERRQREIMALASSKYINNEKIKEVDLAVSKIKTEEDSERFLKELHQTAGKDIQKYGDQKLANSNFIDTFFEEIKAQGSDLRKSSKPAIQLLNTFGITREDLRGVSTWLEIGDLAAFYKQLQIAASILQIPFPELKSNVHMNSLPSWRIPHLLRKYRDPSLRRDGSELVDRHLACLATYADVTFVDKRIKENLIRAARKTPDLSSLLARIERVGQYREIVRYLT